MSATLNRIGLARDFMGQDPDVDWIVESAVVALKKAGATVVDIHYPKWFLDSSGAAVFTLYPSEFKVQIGEYLKAKTGPGYPKSLDDLIEGGRNYRSMGKDGAGPNLSRWQYMVKTERSKWIRGKGNNGTEAKDTIRPGTKKRKKKVVPNAAGRLITPSTAPSETCIIPIPFTNYLWI